MMLMSKPPPAHRRGLKARIEMELTQREQILVDDLMERLAEARRQRDELLALLQGLEWVSHPDYRTNEGVLFCPSCQRGVRAGHASDCTLAAIARARSLTHAYVRARSDSGQAGEQEG